MMDHLILYKSSCYSTYAVLSSHVAYKLISIGSGLKCRHQCTQEEMAERAERRNQLRFLREQRRSRTRAGVVRQASENDYS